LAKASELAARHPSELELNQGRRACGLPDPDEPVLHQGWRARGSPEANELGISDKDGGVTVG